jgi:hypothetical protein
MDGDNGDSLINPWIKSSGGDRQLRMIAQRQQANQTALAFSFRPVGV